MDRDHHFTGNEQTEYDSLNAKGRSAYDRYRWYDKDSHAHAFEQAKELHGLKSPALRKLEFDLVMLQLGLDPRITW